MKTNLLSWTTFGKLSVVIITIWTLIQFADWFSKDSGHLNATIEISDYYLPNDIQSTFSYYNQRNVSSDLVDSINQNIDIYHTEKTDSLTYIYKLQGIISEFIKVRMGSDFFAYHDDYKLIEIRITNPSEKLIGSINVDFDNDGIYQFIDQNEEMSTGIFDHNLNIGNLRALNKCTILIWSTRSWIDAEDIKINYDGGVILPSEIIKVSGFYAWLGKYPIYYNIFVRLLPIVYGGFLIYLLIKFILTKTKKGDLLKNNEIKTE